LGDGMINFKKMTEDIINSREHKYILMEVYRIWTDEFMKVYRYYDDRFIKLSGTNFTSKMAISRSFVAMEKLFRLFEEIEKDLEKNKVKAPKGLKEFEKQFIVRAIDDDKEFEKLCKTTKRKILCLNKLPIKSEIKECFEEYESIFFMIEYTKAVGNIDKKRLNVFEKTFIKHFDNPLMSIDDCLDDTPGVDELFIIDQENADGKIEWDSLVRKAQLYGQKTGFTGAIKFLAKLERKKRSGNKKKRNK
jgi:hypothetical protein